MAPWAKALAAQPEDVSSSPRIPMGEERTNSINFCSPEPSTLRSALVPELALLRYAERVSEQ